MEHVILVTGSMGAGKTTLIGEASDLLRRRNIPHAVLDLDNLELVFLPSSPPQNLLKRNLEAVCANFASAGITRLILAGAIETREELDRLHAITGASDFVVCRLVAPVELMEQRVAAREFGMAAHVYLDRVRVLAEILEEAKLEDFTVRADAQITAMADELLRRAGWIGDGSGHGR